MLPQAKAKASSERTIFCRQGNAAQPPKHYAEPTDAQQKQGTTTEKDARAEALRRLLYPCFFFRRRAILFKRRACLPAQIGQNEQ
ncbi:MAG: hypothetical protein H9535_05745 [Ignavibacteria bacterium]|nr:hypothetical protein [Ignavibacteria bacterium]